MKSNKRISAGKRFGNPGYRTSATWRSGVALKTKIGQTKSPQFKRA